jgi:hypothetical protein
MSKNLDYIKAVRRANREVELESENGWKAKHKVHNSKKAYTRKVKYRNLIFA